MKRKDTKINIIYAILFIYLSITYIFGNNILKTYSYIINPIFWIMLAIITYLVLKKEKSRLVRQKDNLKMIIIFTIFFILIFFLSGLVFNFYKNIYKFDLPNVFKNFYAFIFIIFLKEFVRSKLVIYSGKERLQLFIITMLMVLSDIGLYNINNIFISSEMAFKYFFSTIFPIITLNCLCTYFATITSSMGSCFYRGLIMIAKVYAPIIPDLDWFMMGMLEGLYPPIVFFIMHYYNAKKNSREGNNRIKRGNPTILVLIILFLGTFGLFVGDLLIYRPVAVMSGSMQPIFCRGDAVIVKKITKENLNTLKKYDIIEYSSEGRIILHRIINIENENGKLLFTTKGDNNDSPDEEKVTEENIKGKVEFTVKYVGFPSVLLNDYFNK